jgi:hypothetical protein
LLALAQIGLNLSHLRLLISRSRGLMSAIFFRYCLSD